MIRAVASSTVALAAVALLPMLSMSDTSTVTSPRGIKLEELPGVLGQKTAAYKGIAKHALIIGINNYDNTAQGIPRLNYAVRDAHALHRALVDSLGTRAGFRPENITLLTDDTQTQPTRANVLRALAHLRNKAGANDLVIVFFAGHGTVDSTGRGYLLPKDADLEALGTAIEEDAFKASIHSLRANKVVVFLDACHSGAIGRGSRAVGAEGMLQDSFYRQLAKSEGTTVFSAAKSGEKSFEDDKLRQGVFTAALVDALSGKADQAPRDGLVSLTEVKRYVEDTVDRWAARNGKRQTPVAHVLRDEHGEVPLALNTDVLQERSAELMKREKAGDDLKRQLLGFSLEPGEMVRALTIIDRYRTDEVLTDSESDVLKGIQRLIADKDVRLFRAVLRGLEQAPAPKPEPTPRPVPEPTPKRESEPAPKPVTQQQPPLQPERKEEADPFAGLWRVVSGTVAIRCPESPEESMDEEEGQLIQIRRRDDGALEAVEGKCSITLQASGNMAQARAGQRCTRTVEDEPVEYVMNAYRILVTGKTAELTGSGTIKMSLLGIEMIECSWRRAMRLEKTEP